jgi:hypothetical protein
LKLLGGDGRQNEDEEYAVYPALRDRGQQIVLHDIANKWSDNRIAKLFMLLEKIYRARREVKRVEMNILCLVQP